MVRQSLTRWVSLVVLVSVALGGFACASGGSPASRDTGPTPTPIPTSIVPTNPTYTVQRGDVVQLLQFTGRVAPVTEQRLFFRTGGYVDKVYVRRNQEVKAGDLLAELEVTDLKNQIIQVEAEVNAVRMDYDRRLVEAQNSVRAAELRLAKLEASGNQSQVVRARINVERAQRALADAEHGYNEVLQRPWETEDVRNHYRNAIREAEWNLQIAQAELNDALAAQRRNNIDVELAEMDLSVIMMRVSEIEAGLDITRSLLSLQRLQDQLNDARIVAPFDGVVLTMNLMEGTQVQGYREVMTLADPTALEISADLPDSQMSLLQEGMEVIAEFVNRPGTEYRGVIRWLPYPYGASGTTQSAQEDDRSVRITLLNLDSNVRFEIADRLRLTVELERSEDTLWLPPQAVRTFEGRSFVVVQEGGAQRRLDVRLGIRSDERVEILDGLTEGQVVIAQ